jgi:hypothetical protein
MTTLDQQLRLVQRHREALREGFAADGVAWHMVDYWPHEVWQKLYLSASWSCYELDPENSWRVACAAAEGLLNDLSKS